MDAPPYPWESQAADSSDSSDSSEEIQLSLGRRAPYAMVADWVGLADIAAQAKNLYWVYVMHLNRVRGDQKAWPTRKSLARLLGVDSVRTVDRNNKILEKLGAIEVRERWSAPKVRGANLVIVHETPPQGYAGPVSLEDFYRRQKACEQDPQK